MVTMQIAAAVAMASCAAVAQGLAVGIEAEGVLLKEWPMIATHNAGTGYLNSDNVFLLPGNDAIEAYLKFVPNPERVLLDAAKNQLGSFSEQLDCGARTLVIRPRVYEGRLIMHHNSVGVNHTLAAGLQDVLSWAAANPGELVLLGMFYCYGTDCIATMKTTLADAGITYLENCTELAALTVTGARSLGELSGGGSALAVAQACIDENYDPEIRCRLDGGISCLGGDAQPFAALREYLVELTNTNFTENILNFQNAHWQYIDDDVLSLIASSTSILEDSDDSNINAFVAGLVDSGLLPNINLLQVDNICGDGGDQLSYSVQSQSAAQGMRSPVPNPPSPSPAATLQPAVGLYALLAGAFLRSLGFA